MGHYLPQQSDIYIKNEFLPGPTRPSLGVHYIKIKIKTLILSVLSFVALIAIGVMTQQPIQIQTTAAEAVTCGRCSNTNLGKWATFKTNDACAGGVSSSAQPIPGTEITYTDKAECVNTASTAVCTFDKLASVPDWAKGNDSLGNGDYCGPVQGQSKPVACGNQDSGWIGGPRMDAGTYIGVAGHAPNWAIPLNGKLPVAYDSRNDITRHEYSGKNGETNWSRFLRRIDDSYFAVHSSQVATNQISTGTILKYEILRIGRDSVHNLTEFSGNNYDQQIQDYKDGKLKVVRSIKNADGQQLQGQTITPQLLSQVTGFDVTGLDLTQWSGTEADRVARMIADTSVCTNVPAPQPVSATPVSCEEHLIVPPAGFATNFPSYSSNASCADYTNTRELTDSGRTELDVCGEYWISAWCNGNKQNAVYACRGWSQSNDNALLLNYTNRLRAITTTKGSEGDGGQLISNINQYGDVRGRRITWNNFMNEVKSGKVAYPYEFSNANKSAEEVRDNALQAAATAIFGKSWGAIREQERINNCSTTWDGATTAVTPSTSPSSTPTVTPNPTPTTKPTTQPTVQPTPTPRALAVTPTPTTMPKVASVAFVNESDMKVASTPAPTTTPTNANAVKVAEDTTLDGAIGKDKNGNYFAPAAVVANDKLYIFVIGDGGASSNKHRSDWYNAFVTQTSDGKSWNNYTNLSGTFSSPIKTTKLTTGNTDYIYALGQGSDAHTYFKSTNSQGDFATSWNTISSSSSQNASATTQREVRFKDHVYSFTTDGGKLKVCVDKQICRP